MTVHLVRNHSHWGAFFAEVEDGRIVGVRPFEKDPDPSHLINAIPGGVHSKSRIAQPMDGPDVGANTKLALAYCLQHPQWRLSLQTHKILDIR